MNLRFDRRGNPSPTGHTVQISVPKAIALRSSDVVLDLGAHVGAYADHCLRAGVRRVVAVEAHPRNCEVLAANFAGCPEVEIVHAAVVPDSHTELTVTLHTRSAGGGYVHSVERSGAHDGEIVVPAVKLGAVLSPGVTVLKVDVEGLEHSLGLERYLRQLRALAIDFHGRPDDARRLVAAIRAAGFRAVVEPAFKEKWEFDGAWEK